MKDLRVGRKENEDDRMRSGEREGRGVAPDRSSCQDKESANSTLLQ